ncbi:purine/pyrimidine permease [Mesorhizobium sp. BR1-1-16]|uniref:uracil-xanthine permease family protein n=1 Tax=Mesorhizobium sp. BR1-1-16 TaxID=2876653 RepID=UPI001CCCCB48|nr:solute carrier family 23 protein [Mesorhizobium sp. BR1-1-16]MBZ9938356.1 purine/pyrimidine permease [Mesorhizobium sp. BR1-1-16]
MIALKMPPSRPRRRPHELSFSADEKPPIATAITLGFQHAVMALGLLAYTLALARYANLSVDQTRNLLAVTIIAMAIGTALQAWGGRLGSGSLMIHMPSVFMVPLAGPILAVTGPGGMVTMTVVSAVATLAIAPLLPRLRGLFPPIVAGLVVLIGGMSLVGEAVEHSWSLGHDFVIDIPSLIMSSITLALIVGLSVWGNRRLKLLALLIGVVAGVAAAFFMGRLEGGAVLMSAAPVAMPELVTPVVDIPVGLLLGLAFIAILTQIDTVGSLILLDRMDDADWRRPDMKQASRGVLGAGIADLIGGVLGSMPTATSSANIGLCHASAVTSRTVGLATAAILMLVAFLPQATLALTLIPTPVIGAIELYAAAFLMAAGIDLIASRELDTRGIFIVGISLLGGVTVLLMPGLAERAHPALRHLVGSGFIVTGVIAIVLNLVFRLGIRRQLAIKLAADGPPVSIQITDFIEEAGGSWAARRDVVRRAALAAVEAAEAIDQAGGDRHVIGIGGSFDELNLDIELVHSGAPMPVGDVAVADLESLLDGDDDSAIDAAMSSISGTLLRRLADRLSSRAGPEPGTSILRLHFEH